MASWKGEIGISVLGFSALSLGQFELHKLGEKQIKTINVCPNCLVVPENINRDVDKYRCPKCGSQFKSWTQLKRAIPNGDSPPIPIPQRKTEKTAKISLKLLDLSEVSGLLTKAEYAIIPKNEASKRNIQKIGAMLLRHNKVAVFNLVFRKGGERHILYFTVNDDGMILAREMLYRYVIQPCYIGKYNISVKEIIPLNLVKPLPAGIVFADENIPENEIQELLNAMPKATEDDLNVVDEVIEAIPKTEETADLTKKLKKVLVEAKTE